MSRHVCKTVGELRKALQRWKDEKVIILDVDGDTFDVAIDDWSSDDDEDLESPVAIYAE